MRKAIDRRQAWATKRKDTEMNKCHILPLAFITLTFVASCAPRTDLASDAITIDSLLTVAEVYVGDTMTVKGIVKSVCANVDGQAQTIVITDSSDINRLRIDVTAPSEVEGLSKGDAMAVRGVLGETRTSKGDLREKEVEADSVYAAGHIGKEAYESMKNDIAAKKAFIEFQRRDYYSEFHIEATQVDAL